MNIAKTLAAAAAALALLGAGATLWQYDWLRGGESWAQRLQADAITIDTENDEKLGRALLFHGCAGDYDPHHQPAWARFFADLGYDTVIVDSLEPRGVTPERAHNLVCKGYFLRGQERAKDVGLALSHFTDGAPALLVGWSHGAWAILELLSREHPSTQPAVSGLILFYPYCGSASTIDRAQLRKRTEPILVFLARHDDLTEPAECLDLFSETSATIVWMNTNHGFDLEDSERRYDPPYAGLAKSIIEWFVKGRSLDAHPNLCHQSGKVYESCGVARPEP